MPTSCEDFASAERNDTRPLIRSPAAKVSPFLHEPPSLLEEIAAPVSGLDAVRDRVRQRHFDDVVRIAALSPPPNRGTSSGSRARSPQGAASPARPPWHPGSGTRLRCGRGTPHRSASRGSSRKDRQRPIRQRHPMLLVALHALAGDRPDRGGKSTSDQRAKRASPVRTAVRMVNSSARAGIPGTAATRP